MNESFDGGIFAYSAGGGMTSMMMNREKGNLIDHISTPIGFCCRDFSAFISFFTNLLHRVPAVMQVSCSPRGFVVIAIHFWLFNQQFGRA